MGWGGKQVPENTLGNGSGGGGKPPTLALPHEGGGDHKLL